MLWWGSTQSAPFISALLAMPSDVPQASDVLVLSDTSLQRWRISFANQEKVSECSLSSLKGSFNCSSQLLYDFPLEANLRPFLKRAEADDGYSVGRIWLLDMSKGRCVWIIGHTNQSEDLFLTRFT